VALKTTLEQLQEVQDAISAVMAGQAYSIGGRSVTKANLDALHEREKYLEQKYYREQAGATRNRVEFRRPT